MKLYLSPTSPYARLVNLTLEEKGLGERVERVYVDPWASPPELTAVNPLSRVPALVTDVGTVLTESLVISQYLERAYPQPALIPGERMETVLRRLSLGHGLIDHAVGIVSVRRFHPDAEEQDLLQRRHRILRQSLPVVAEELHGEAPTVDLGHIALVVALDYLSFRFTDIGWRDEYPELARWRDGLAERPSFADTAPR